MSGTLQKGTHGTVCPGWQAAAGGYVDLSCMVSRLQQVASGSTSRHKATLQVQVTMFRVHLGLFMH